MICTPVGTRVEPEVYCRYAMVSAVTGTGSQVAPTSSGTASTAITRGRWSAGLLQKRGYVKGHYGSGENRYRALGTDLQGCVYIPLYFDRAPTTHPVAGHPVIAGPEGQELFVQVTHVGQAPDRWHVSVNNPTDKSITTTLTNPVDLPGFDFPAITLRLKPGEYVVLR